MTVFNMRSHKILLLTASLLLAFTLIGGLSIGSSGQQEIDLENGLVGYWGFDEGEGDIVFDESINNNDGLLKCAGKGCSPSKWVEGKTGLAMKFDRVDDYINCGNSDVFNYLKTVTAWFRTSQLSTGIIVSKTNTLGNSAKGWACFHEHRKLECRFSDNDQASFTRIYSSTLVEDNTWHHAALVITSEDIAHLYLDGKEEATLDLSNYNTTNARYLVIGGRDAAAYPFKGLIDEVRIYNRALTENEIIALYEQAEPD